MISKSLVYVILIAITIVISFFFNVLFDRMSRDEEPNKEFFLIDTHYFVEDTPIDPMIKVMSTSGDTLFFLEVLGSSRKLVINFDQKDCSTCFETINSSVLNFFNDFGYHNVILIGSFQNYRSFMAFCDNYGGFYEMYYLIPQYENNSQIKFKSINNVYLFTTNDKLEQEIVFIPNSSPEDESAIESYLNILVTRFFKL